MGTETLTQTVRSCYTQVRVPKARRVRANERREAPSRPELCLVFRVDCFAL